MPASQPSFILITDYGTFKRSFLIQILIFVLLDEDELSNAKEIMCTITNG